jgi:hypothetical protein
MAQLLYGNQFVSKTLSVGGGINASQTTGIVISNTTGLTTTKPGIAALTWADPLDEDTVEWIEYTSIDGSNEFIGVTRGAEGGTARTHDNGAVVAFPISESHINRIVDKLDGTDTTALTDTNGNELLKTSTTTSAVNELTIKNAATGNNPEVQATGGDTNIGITFVPKGTGVINLSNTSMAGATPATAQENLADATATQVVLGTEIYDVGSNFASNAYTAPTTGYYLVTASITYTSVTAAKAYRASIYVNDAEVARATQHSGLADTIAVPIYGIFSVTAGQTIKLYATQISGGAAVDIQNGSLYTFMHVVRLY